jgi:ubiquinone/menaquinone biosynthesis C-methylase UbiE
MPHILLYVALAVVLLALGYWLLVITEGTYLGPRVVALLYDWTAHSYDRIKKLHFVDEASHIGIPLVDRLETIAAAGLASTCVIDLACGTGRIALALRLAGGYEGLILGLDRSPGMLRVAHREASKANVAITLLAGDVHRLPFTDHSAHAVTCLESIEFFGQPERVLAECYRVLRPGGILLTSNRVGVEARWMPFRYAGRGRQEALLRQLGYQQVDTERWQVHYDLIWAIKPVQDGDVGEIAS